MKEYFDGYLKEKGIKKLTEVQKKIFSPIVDNKSLLVTSPTGTGKTLAYLMPLFSYVKTRETELPINDVGAPRALILAPTKELARQIYSVAKELSHHVKLRVRLSLSGDKDVKTKKLKSDFVDIVVGVPGKMASDLSKGVLKKGHVETIIFDEADQIMDMGFKKDVENIYALTKENFPQFSLVSATMPISLYDFIQSTLSDIEFTRIDIDKAHQIQQQIETYNVYMGAKEKQLLLEQFISKQARGNGFIFVNQKETVKEIHDFLKERHKNKKFYVLHGKMTGPERKKQFKAFSENGGILICTDIAARGIDVDDVNWVLNYDLPFEAVYYIHRSGRTGRKGAPGQVFNFVTNKDENIIARINEAIKNQTALKLNSIKALKAAPSKRVTSKKVSPRSPKKGIKRSPGFMRRKKKR